MLDTETKRRIDSCRDILVGKVPDPKSQVEQITIALIYKFMSDMDAESVELGGKRKFFAGDYRKYDWSQLMASNMGGHDVLHLYSEAITKMSQNTGLPELFRDIFKNAFLPYRDPETLRAFLKEINSFTYDHSEKLGDAFEYLLSVLGSQGDAGQFRTPRHIIDFMVDVMDPQRNESILDPACGTAGFLISSYKHIVRKNTSQPSPPPPLPKEEGSGHYRGGYDFSELKKRARELRKNQTAAEEFLWEFLRNRQCCGAKFRRQHQCGDYICDFYCHEAHLVIECDGEIHATAEQRKKDQRRDAYLKSQGLEVIRFQNEQVLNHTEEVLKDIVRKLPLPGSSPYGRGGGEGSPGKERKIVPRPGDLLTSDDRKLLVGNIRGYDISPDMVRLSLVNLYLHGFTEPHIEEYDTLTSEEKWNELSDVILANPPFMSPKGGIKPHKRFAVQAKRSEVLFMDYIAEHLTPTGRAAVIVPEGIIFQSGTAYKQLRKMLVEQSLVAVVSLPAGVFQPYSGVKTSILIMNKRLAKKRDDILFVKIENDGFGLGAQRREVPGEQLTEAAELLKDWMGRARPPGAPECGRLGDPSLPFLAVPKNQIAENGEFNLSGERYKVAEMLSSDYPLVELGEVCNLIGGGTPSKKDASFWENGSVKWISSKHINDQFQVIGSELITEKAVQSSATKVVPKGSTILITRVSVGKFAFADEDYAVNQDLTGLVVKAESQLNPKYLFCISKHLAEIIERSAEGIGVRGVTRKFLSSLQIPLPPLAVQQEIVAEIEGYQKVIDGARTVLENYRPHIPIHPDWPMVELAEICDAIKTGPFGSSLHQSDYVEEGIPVINPQNIIAGNLVSDGAKMVSSETRDRLQEFTVRENDIVIGRRGELGRCGVVEKHMDGWLCGTGSFVIRLNMRSSARFVSLQITSQHVKRYLEEHAIGVTMKNLNQSILRAIKIPHPPLEEQQAIVAEIEAEQALVAANRELIERFEEKIKQTIARVWGETE